MPRFFNPVPGYTYPPFGKLYFYVASTDTKLNTYVDEAETVANTNPVLLDSLGRIPNIWFTSKTRVVLHNADNEQVWERDPIGGSDTSAGGITVYDPSTGYDKDQITRTGDGVFYISLQGGNKGNDPAVTPESNAFWMEINFIDMYNSSKPYMIGNISQTPNGFLWRSLIDPNLGNDPSTDLGGNWLPAIDGSKIPEITALESDISDLQDLNTWGDPVTASFIAATNKSRQIDASIAPVDITLPTLVAGDSFTYHNIITSTFKVQILNPTQTITGTEGTIAAGTNLEIEPGQTVQMVAATTGILLVVGAIL